LVHSERSWKSSWASWCSREEKRELACLEGREERAEIMSRGRMEEGEEWDVLRALSSCSQHLPFKICEKRSIPWRRSSRLSVIGVGTSRISAFERMARRYGWR
jgi:hypothetical protein